MREELSFEAAQDDIAKQQYHARRIAETLHAITESVEDSTFGSGVIFTPWDTDDITFEWYPATDVLRLQTQDIKVLLRRLGEPLIGQEQVIFSREDAQGKLCQFALTRKGEVTL